MSKTNVRPHDRRRRSRRLGAVVAAATIAALTTSTTVDAEPQGYIDDVLAYSFIYGTFDQPVNTALIAGGTIEESCAVENGDVGEAPLRVYLRDNGEVDLKTNAKDQPIHLYTFVGDDPLTWIVGLCQGGGEIPEPFASGTADLKVRITDFAPGAAAIFNSVNGFATAPDGTEYKVRASADFEIEGGAPTTAPADFVAIDVTEIKRG